VLLILKASKLSTYISVSPISISFVIKAVFSSLNDAKGFLMTFVLANGTLQTIAFFALAADISEPTDQKPACLPAAPARPVAGPAPGLA
jgi:hypothetical protein